ncbi:winged helix-turn-helix domain-containing protein [Luteibacter yeojuensis]|uniref:Winged helix-turn-helix transcriptional regulator n=1 Tax=Luteibacter yeojuensis TaxID=345309 RepID=A0A7X5QVY0_9GAMM|nr:winged helix-turn-helix domain-containing protein [Luteibacter yeojuensis]NID16334.1 winged helix-turn-helix transcriptional regulator [Luteibacter yeojuensis]
MNPLAQKTVEYLQAILPGAVGLMHPLSLELRNGLPHYLTRFDLYELRVARREVLLAIAPKDGTGGETKKMLHILATKTGLPVLYVLPSIQSYERQRMIEAGIEFVVPGSQLFAPTLGLALREQFATALSDPSDLISPSAQAILITMLLDDMRSPVVASALAAKIGYTGMTATRAVRDLVAHGLVEQRRQTRTKVIALTASRADTWKRAKPLMRSPVLRTEHPRRPEIKAGHPVMRLAGVDALSHLTMLAEPKHHIWAVSQMHWVEIQRNQPPVLYAGDAQEAVQVWSYPPTLGGDTKTVDPLSLILSMNGSDDERVLMAIDELETKLWR